jgi:hypothetical protein
MEPFIVQATIKLAEGIYYLITNPKDYHPERLSGNMLALFQEFKATIDGKDISKLRNTLSDSYSGSFLGAKTKSALLNSFVFENLPSWVYPSLTINIYQILEDNNKIFRIILDFKTYYKVALVPFPSNELGRVHVEARPDGAYGMWRITCIDTIRD